MSASLFVVTLTRDPMVTAGIQAAAAAAGIPAEFVVDTPALWEAIDRWPALLLIDLTAPDWETPVRRAKIQPHTRAIPTFTFGPSIDPQAARVAHAAGCKHLGTYRDLNMVLPGLLEEILHPPMRWVEGWDAPPPEALRHAVEQFNSGEYWECHETLETLWVAERRPIRDFYQGILQIGVAFHHLQQRNYAGAIKMFRRGLPRLRGLPEVCQGVCVTQLAIAARTVHDAAEMLGPGRIGELDLAVLPKAVMTGSLQAEV